MAEKMAMHVRARMSVKCNTLHMHASRQASRDLHYNICAAVTHARLTRRNFGEGAPFAHICTHAHRCLLAHSIPPSPRVGRQKAATKTAASATQFSVGTDNPAAATAALYSWLTAERGLPTQGTRPQNFQEGSQAVLGFAASRYFSVGEVVMEVGGDCSVTSVDVAEHPVVGALAAGRGELTGLALWLMAEREQGARSFWAPFLAALPERTLSPILWSDEELEALKGSPVAAEAAARKVALHSEWAALGEKIAADPSLYPAGVFNKGAYLEAMSVVLAAALYLPAAQCFALVPLLSSVRRSGRESASTLDYNAQRESVTLTTSAAVGGGEEVRLYDGRPSGEMLLACGSLEDDSPADHLTLEASLVASDRLFGMKKQILEDLGLTTPQAFPITRDGFPLQLLSYLRLARLQDPAEFAKVTFETDVPISPNNEYEVLQLLLADCRDLMSAYPGNIEEDVKILQGRELNPKARLATRLRLQEKLIVQGTMDAVRRRLAPIRGIPTKKGQMTDPNSDLREIFESIESIPAAPKKLLDGIRSWARGEQDPTWKK